MMVYYSSSQPFHFVGREEEEMQVADIITLRVYLAIVDAYIKMNENNSTKYVMNHE